MAQKKVIKIDGRQYDATTGRPVTPEKKAPIGDGGNIDGFKKLSSSSSRDANVLHLTKSKSKTLNRVAVASKKPEKNPIERKKAISTVQSSQKKNLTGKIDTRRKQRSSSVKKSTAINKFNEEESVFEGVAQATATIAEIAPQVAPPMPTHKARNSSRSTFSPLKERRNKAKKDRNNPKAKVKSNKTSGFKVKAAPVFASVAAAILLGGYFVYLNIPNFAFRIAASRAGIEASIPAYKPVGFDFSGPVSYTQGQVVLGYSSGGDERNFDITQRSSSWDSESLLDNYVLRETSKHLTFQERGLTIYVFDGSNATWVDGGIWYTIEGDSLLSSEQLIRIASSM